MTIKNISLNEEYTHDNSIMNLMIKDNSNPHPNELSELMYKCLEEELYGIEEVDSDYTSKHKDYPLRGNECWIH